MTCNAINTCDNLADQIFGSGSGQFVKNMVLGAGLFAPLLLGLFLGSPLIAREYEEGTAQLVWTQSVSRRKWLTTKLTWALGFAFLYGLAVTSLITWWSRTSNAVYLDRFDPAVFSIQGLMPIAISLLFTAAGFAIGTWFRKTVLAMAIIIGLFLFLQSIFPNVIRQHYMTPVTVTSQFGPDAIDSKIPAGAWVLSRGDIISKSGRITSFDAPYFPSECQKLTQNIRVPNGSHIAKLKAAGIDPVDDCLNRHGFRQIATYQPASRYWDFQRIEASIYLGMTALAVVVTYWLVLKRDA